MQEESVGKSDVVIFLEFSDLLSMFLLQPCKADDIEALKDMGGVGWVSQNLDILVTGVIHELKTIVRGMSVNE